jgi:WhiB family redox-sensing transcriptional regulator
MIAYDEDDLEVYRYERWLIGPGLARTNQFVRGGEIRLPQNWMPARPSCADADPEVFHPKKGDHAAIKIAKRICSHCPILDTCREHSIDEQYGIWGGLGPRERRVLRKRRGVVSRGRRPRRVAA